MRFAYLGGLKNCCVLRAENCDELPPDSQYDSAQCYHTYKYTHPWYTAVLLSPALEIIPPVYIRDVVLT